MAVGTGVPGNFRYPEIQIHGEWAHVGLPRRFRRDAVLAAHGLQILRFRNEEVMNNLDDILKRIRMACQARVDPLYDPPPTREEFTSPPLVGEKPEVGSHPPSPQRGEVGGGVP